ncbi:MAG: ROK family protein [Thaumarchaeota archaeon]|nr:ROK family protein [Candidatus Calditenuaceae archaeon]MDW8187051.1 ROK family protein [Nitrososphaerota archaeon]
MEAVLAVDVGATWLRVGLVDISSLKLIKLTKVPTPQTHYSDAIPEALRSALMSTIAGVRLHRAAGVASIGPLDSTAGEILKAPNVVGRPSRVDVASPLIELGLVEEVYLINDCNAAALAEWWARRTEGVEDLLYVTISTGIGAGCVLSSRPLLGRRGNAMELGHVVVDPSGYLPCGCGGKGHWEAYGSGGNVLAFARRLLEDGHIPKSTQLWAYVDSGGRDPSEVFRLYRAADPGAAAFCERLASIQAAGLASAVNVLDPEVLVLGGSVYLGNRDFFVNDVFPMMERYLMLESPVMEDPVFGEHSPIVGAAIACSMELEGARVLKRK